MRGMVLGIGKLLGIGAVSAGLLAVPAGIDQRVLVVDGSGAAMGTVGNPINVTGAGGGGGLSVTDGAAWTAGTSSFTPGGGVFNDSATALTSGQQGNLRMTPNRAQHVNLRSQNGTEVLPVPAALADATSNPTLTATQGYPMLFNGTSWDRLRDSTGATNGTVGTMAAGLMVFDTVDAQNKRANSVASGIAGGLTGKNIPGVGPMHYTVVYGAAPTNYTAGLYAHQVADRAGVPFVVGGHPNTTTIRANYTTAQTDTAIVTVATGTKIVVTGCTVTASNADTVNVSAVVGFGTTTTPTTTGVFLAGSGIPPGGGVNRGDGSGVLGAGADDEDVRITSGVPTGGSIDVVLTYYTVPS